MESNTLTNEELKEAKVFHKLMEDNMRGYKSWYQYNFEGEFLRAGISESTIEKATELAATTSMNAIYSIGYYGMNILHQLVTHNFYDAVKILLERGADPNATGKEGHGDWKEAYIGVTPFHIACASGNIEMAKLLLSFGADTTLKDNQGRNCHHYLGGVDKIFSNGTNFDMRNVVQVGEIFPFLKCNVTDKDNNGISPFMNLLKRGNKITTVLTDKFIKAGADVYERDEDNNTTLILAVREKNDTATCILSKYKDLVNAVNNEGETALHIACRNYYRRALYMLSKNGADPSINNANGKSVLQMIREDRNYEKTNSTEQLCEKFLLNKRLRPKDYLNLMDVFNDGFWDAVCSDISMFMYEFAREVLTKLDMDDDTDHEYIMELVNNYIYLDETCYIVKILHEMGYDLCGKLIDRSKVTTIRDICCEYVKRGQLNAFKWLHELGVDLETPLVDGKTPAYIICRYADGAKDCIPALEYCSVESMETLSNEGLAAIHMVVGHKDEPHLLEYMIKRGVNVNLTTDSPAKAGDTPLHIACRYNNVEAVKALKKAGADDSITNINEEIPAYCLFDEYDRFYHHKDALEILKLLDTVHCKVAKTGDTPMLKMYRKRQNDDTDYAMTEIFLEKGVDVDHCDNYGNTPLMEQADGNRVKDILKLLLSEGADINARNEDGESALIYLIKHWDVELARFFIKKGADYNIVNSRNETPASLCIEKGMEEVLELMTDIKVFPTSENNDYDDDDDYDDYEEDEDEDDFEDEDDYDDEEDEEETKARIRESIIQGYIQAFGLEKGTALGSLVLRMNEINEEGLNADNMEEDQALALKVQEIMTS